MQYTETTLVFKDQNSFISFLERIESLNIVRTMKSGYNVFVVAKIENFRLEAVMEYYRIYKDPNA